VSFAKELGSFERELYEFTAQDHSQVPLSVRDVTMLAERLGVMSHSPAQIQVCVCVFVCERESVWCIACIHAYACVCITHTHTHTHTGEDGECVE
jgi:hypothetical protein